MNTYYMDGSDTPFTLKTNLGDIWWWCESEPCMTEVGTWTVNYRTGRFRDEDASLDDYVNDKYTYLSFPQCWD